jgi:hypothetical protein
MYRHLAVCSLSTAPRRSPFAASHEQTFKWLIPQCLEASIDRRYDFVPTLAIREDYGPKATLVARSVFGYIFKCVEMQWSYEHHAFFELRDGKPPYVFVLEVRCTLLLLNVVCASLLWNLFLARLVWP